MKLRCRVGLHAMYPRLALPEHLEATLAELHRAGWSLSDLSVRQCAHCDWMKLSIKWMAKPAPKSEITDG